MTFQHIGKDFTPPDVRAKVTGRARYAEDVRSEGMAFCKLLTSARPHARVTDLDVSRALAIDGVYGVLLPEDLPESAGGVNHTLTREPRFVGDPILAVAAVDETTAAAAIDAIRLTYDDLPFVVDPLASLSPGGANAHTAGNILHDGPIREVKWSALDFASVDEHQLPTGEHTSEFEFGDVAGGLEEADLVLDETFVTASHPHHSMETRSAFAYWENGRCFVHGSTQSQSHIMDGLARMLGIEVDRLVYVSEFCGGGFGSKGSAYPIMTVPAFMAKKIGRPCMLRITRAEEYSLGSARAGFQGRVKLGFRADGRLLAADLFIVQQNGPKGGFNDCSAAGDAVSLVYSPVAMRYRGIRVATNTTPSGAQRGPGQNQIACVMEPLLDKAARALGVDRLRIREMNAPTHEGRVEGSREVSSSYMREAIALAARRFDWDAKIRLSGQRTGSKVFGVGIGQAYHSAGNSGFDGLVRITPDGVLHIHTGVGNLGTYSYAATSRVAAEVLGMPWDRCVIERGDSRRHLPRNQGQFGSNSSFTMSRTNYVAAMDAKRKLQEIAAMDLGGAPEDYDVASERVFRSDDPQVYLTFARAATRAVEIGGRFDGHEMPDNLYEVTRLAVRGVAGTGLVGVAKDELPDPRHVPALAVGMMLIELDTETGKIEIRDYVGTVDCGTVIHPMGLAAQIRGGAVMGVGMASLERVVYDPDNGLPANVGLHQCKPPSIMDAPDRTVAEGVNQPDRDIPYGMKGIGEPPMGAAASAMLSAMSDALGGYAFNRTPVLPDMIVNAAAGRSQSHTPLQVNTQ